MSAATRISSLDALSVACTTELPSSLTCMMQTSNFDLLSGLSLDFQIEQPNYKTAESNEKYFNGKLQCHAFTGNSFRSDVRYFSVDIKDGKLSVQVPKVDDTYTIGYINCYGTEVSLPANFGVVKLGNGYIAEDRETPLRIRAEYKGNGYSRQFSDAGYSTNLVHPPTRGLAYPTDEPVPYLPLSKAISVESSKTILDAQTGFKLVLKEVQHSITGIEIANRQTSGDIRASVFSSLAPLNTYYEGTKANYVNCTAEISGSSAQTFDTILTLHEAASIGSMEFKTRGSTAGEWVDVTVDTTGNDITVSCPHLTVLNPTKLPTFIDVQGLGASKDGANYNHAPSIVSYSSASGFVSFTVFSVVTIAAAALSMF